MRGALTDPLLEVTDLHTYIRQRDAVVRAVDGVTLTVGTGETLGIVGESGSGKTMTGLSLIRLLPQGGFIASGSIRFGGKEITKMTDREIRDVRGRDIGVVFQDPMTSLNPTMKIGRQIAEGVVRHRRVSIREADDRAREVLELVGMPRPAERLDDYPHQLSGGLRQRVMIAIALACDPKLLIADEPTTALDVTIQRQILDLLDRLKGQMSMSMILITHDLGVIAGRADRVLVMYAGRVVEEAPTVDLFHRPRHRYTEALLKSIPRLDTDPSSELYSIPGLPPDLSLEQSGCGFAPRCAFATGECRVADPEFRWEGEHRFACIHPSGVYAPPIFPSLGSSGVQIARPTRAPIGTAHSLARRIEPASGGEPLLVLDHVVKEFPVTAGAVLQRTTGSVKAVSNVSLSIARGETFGLVGESGCGKTTLGRLMVALERPTRGVVSFDGADLAELSRGELRARRRDLQLMFQDPYSSLDPRMRVQTILREPFKIHHVGSRQEQQSRILELLSEVGLAQRAIGLYPHEFSGGQRQRIGFARALALGPKLIVADEPVSALDVSIRSQILNLMKELQDAHDLTYVVISHDLSVIRYLADRIGVMYLGKLVELGDATEIYAAPAHPYTSALIDTVPVPEPKIERKKKGALLEGELPSPINPPSGCRFRTRCPLAQEVCAAEEPPLVAFGGSSRRVACHFPLGRQTDLPAGSNVNASVASANE